MQTVNSTQPTIVSKDYLTVAQEVAEEIAAAAFGYDVDAGLPVEEVTRLKESSLLLLPVPRKYGGAGASWPELYRVVRTLAGASGSVGQLYANHIGLVNAAVPLGRPGQAEHAYQVTARHNLLWANALTVAIVSTA